MKKSNLKLVSLLCFISFTILISSCKKEDANLCEDEFLGFFRLLKSSTESIPFNKTTKLIFQDSLGDEVVMQFKVDSSNYNSGQVIYTGKCKYDETYEKEYRAEIDLYNYIISEVGDSLDMDFKIRLIVEPFNNNFGNVNVSDKLHLFRIVKNNSSDSEEVLTILVNQRELTYEELSNFPKPQSITLLGREFEDVYYDYNALAYYNYSYGLIAFRDWDNNLWVLNRTE